jgi:hypothetical protein
LANHDFFCGTCGQLLLDIHVPIAIGATAGAPVHCGAPTTPIPGIGRMDAGGVKGASFKAFETTDGQNRKVLIDALATLRRIERESEQQARNGEGQPIVFRAWSQDRSNRDRHTLGTLSAERPDPAYVQKFGKAIRSATEPDAAYGPGVSDANTSALPLAGGE